MRISAFFQLTQPAVFLWIAFFSSTVWLLWSRTVLSRNYENTWCIWKKNLHFFCQHFSFYYTHFLIFMISYGWIDDFDKIPLEMTRRVVGIKLTDILWSDFGPECQLILVFKIFRRFVYNITYYFFPSLSRSILSSKFGQKFEWQSKRWLDILEKFQKLISSGFWIWIDKI